MKECPFGYGILSQGEIIVSPEQDRLLAKKAWLFLHEYMIRNNELIKANRIPVPWSLDEDMQLKKAMFDNGAKLDRFKSAKHYSDYYSAIDLGVSRERVEKTIHGLKNIERFKWMFDSTIAENPLTVLDVGAGYGELAIVLARSGIQITALNIHDFHSKPAREIVKDEALPIDFISGIFETLDFKQTKFDVVICGEVIEHVGDDLSLIQKCVNIAKQSVIITTPVGAMDHGFLPNSEYDKHDQHVRAYSNKSFKTTLDKLVGIKKDFKILIKGSWNNIYGEIVPCFCVKLEKEVLENATKTQSVEPETIKV